MHITPASRASSALSYYQVGSQTGGKLVLPITPNTMYMFALYTGGTNGRRFAASKRSRGQERGLPHPVSTRIGCEHNRVSAGCVDACSFAKPGMPSRGLIFMSFVAIRREKKLKDIKAAIVRTPEIAGWVKELNVNNEGWAGDIREPMVWQT